MERILNILTIFLLLTSPAWATTYNSDGSASDVQSKINSASDGDTVLIPSGIFTWSSAVSIGGKGIKLQGAGAGRVVGRSTSSVAVGTGSKSFTTQSGLSISAGSLLRITHTANGANFMEGTVTSYSGNTLSINITTVGGSGTWAFWAITTPPATTINSSIAGVLNITEDASHCVEVSGIKFVTTYETVSSIYVYGNGNARPVLIHDCWFSVNSSGRMFSWESNRGVIWNCSFDNSFWSGGYNGSGNDAKAIGFVPHTLDSSWTTVSTMGANDSTGLNNVYMEDCDFHGMYLATYDADDNARVVIRHCLFNNSGGGTHGQDTSNRGVRHLEIYENTFIFTDATSDDTYNINSYYFGRGGTGIIASNYMDDINSSEWGDKAEIRMTVYNLRASVGPYPCWGAGIAGSQYPAPRQIGMGYVTGNGYTDPTWGYRGDSEPMYIWGNTGSGGSASPVIGDWLSGCTAPDSSSDYIVLNRDYYLSAKPNWRPYTYPHPLRSGSAPAQDPPVIASNPQSIVCTQGQSASFSVSVSGTAPLSYRWQKNSANIAGATASSYSIVSVTTNHAGSYRCVVTNVYGSATSSQATLTVNVPVPVPPSITANPQSLTRTVGQSTTFTITAAGDAPLVYQWQKNSANIAGATASSYSIGSVTTNDAGNFRCIVTNAYGSATSTVATLAVSAVTGAVRYVDFTAGSDNSAGTAANPWKRCPGMVGWTGTATLQPGDTVYFNRGGTWDIPAITFGPGLEVAGGVHYIGDQWDPQGTGTGRAILRATGTHESGNVRFWADDPTIPTEVEGFEMDGNGYRANGIDINHSHWKTGLTRAVKRIKNCIVHGQTGNGSEGDYKYGIIVSDNSPDASGWVANVEILDTVAYDVPRVGISIYPSDTGMLSNIVVRGCNVSEANSDPSYQASTHGIGIKGNVKAGLVENCYVHDVGGASIFISGPENGAGGGPTDLIVRYNVLQSAAGDGVIRFYKGGNKSVDVYGNIILENESTGGLSLSGNTGTLAARIYNNTFYNAFVDIGSPTSTGTIEFRNNIIYELDDIALTDSGSDITAHSNNLFYRANGGTQVRIGGVNYNASSITNWEATVRTANPLFKNTAHLPTGFTGVYGLNLSPNNDGLSLQESSPGIGTGITLASPYDGSINSVNRPTGGGWDLGAYQHSTGAEAVAPPSNLKIVPL